MEKYIVGYVERDNGSYDFHIVNVVLSNKEDIIRVTEEEVQKHYKLLNENSDNGEIYMLFGGRYKEKDEDGCIAEYWVQEMRCNYLVIRFKIFQLED